MPLYPAMPAGPYLSRGEQIVHIHHQLSGFKQNTTEYLAYITGAGLYSYCGKDHAEFRLLATEQGNKVTEPVRIR